MTNHELEGTELNIPPRDADSQKEPSGSGDDRIVVNEVGYEVGEGTVKRISLRRI